MYRGVQLRDLIGAGLTSSCLPDQEIGEACGYGVGYCVEGADCVYKNPAKTEAVCLKDAKEGEACGGFEAPTCGEFLGCVANLIGSDAGKCKPLGLTGDPCGLAVANCDDLLSCVYDDATETVSSCRPNGVIGDPCGLGVGDCWWPLLCYGEVESDGNGEIGEIPDQGVCGDPCQIEGYYEDGLCDEACWLLDPDCL